MSKRDLVGMPPKLAVLTDYTSRAEPEDSPQINGRRSSLRHGRFGVNMPAIAEVLATYGLDPAVEVAKILTERVPVLDRNGAAVLNEDGTPVTRPQLDPVDHARLASELMQYTRPKLKAMEVTVAPAELSDEQVDRRLQALLAQRPVA